MSTSGREKMQQEIFNIVSCRLCFNVISYTNYEVIEVSRDILEAVLPNMNLEEKHKLHVCKICCSKLFAAFNFKSTCISTENIITPFINASVSAIDLKDVYLKLYGNMQLTDTWENQIICRLCLQLVTHGFVSLHEMDSDVIDAYLPQINVRSTKDSVICGSCFDSLRTHGGFVKNCLKGQEIHIDANKQPYIKTELFEFKQEDCHEMQNTYRDSSTNIKSEDIEIKTEDHNNDSFSHNIGNETTENRNKHNSEDSGQMSKCETDIQINKCKTQLDVSSYKDRIKRKFEGDLKHKIAPKPSHSLEIQMYKCSTCDYETKCKCGLKIHEFKHNDPSKVQTYMYTYENQQLTPKDPPEIQMYKCDACRYETKCKGSLTRHQLTHKHPSEVQMFKCDSCDYKTRYKRYLKTHQLSHKDPSEIQMYTCDFCTFETKYKKSLKDHQLIHKDLSEIPTYLCDKCDYESKRKCELILHQLTHRNPSQIQMYVCDTCGYKAARKSYLKRHQLVHKDLSEIQIYKCDVCGYENKRKYELKKHQLLHKDPSENQMYKCDVCTFQSKYKRSVKNHQILHKGPSEIQVYKCDACTYQSKYKGNLKTHQLTHKETIRII